MYMERPVRDLDDVDCMAKYAVEILGDEELHEELSKNARKRAEKFEMSEIVTVYENYYKEVKEGLAEKETV